MNRNIVIVGGGTAGWLTALFAKKYFYKCNVTLIESQEIGILGAGEGTTPHFINFLKAIDIPLSDLFKHAKATVKNGIKFTDWNGDGEHFFHPFWSYEQAQVQENRYLLANFASTNSSLDPVCYVANISENYRVPFVPKSVSLDGKNTWESRYEKLANYGVHFDARELANFLSSVGEQRGVNRVFSEVVGTLTDVDGYIEALELKTGERIPCDFVFDCTGFARLFIGKHFNTKWKDYKDYIPNDRAIPFFIDTTNEQNPLPPYTEAIAMKYGWVWKIPVQGRYGCGYVFDSSLISDEEAIAELEEKFPVASINRKGFSFKAGCFEQVWVKNCMAVGLSAGFIEPLEATNLWVTVDQLSYLRESIAGVFSRDTEISKTFNEVTLQFNTTILEFLTLHYITQRRDTVYWSNAQAKKNKPVVRDIIESSTAIALQGNVGLKKFGNGTSFSIISILRLLLAQKLCKLHNLNEVIDSLNEYYDIAWFEENAQSIYQSILTNTQLSARHDEFIEMMRGLDESRI